MRGRNNRKGPNPLTRTYESNGPDVKIRGTAQHITEKYLQLARDAQASGDTVVAENYLQHAEHYYRIIASAQAAQAQAQMGYGRPGEEIDDGDEDDDFIAMPDRFASPFERAQPAGMPGPNGQGQPMNPMGMGQQPYLDRPAFTGEFMDRQGNGERQERQERPDRQERQGQDRAERQDRQPQDRQDRQDRPDRQDRQDRPNRNDRRFNAQGERGERAPSGRGRFRDQPRFEPAPEAREQPDVDFGAMSALPAFITAPVRPVAPTPVVEPEQPSTEPAFAPPPAAPVEAAAAPAAPEAPAAPASEEGEGQFALRPRPRRRRTAAARAEEAPAESGPTEAPEPSSAE